MNSHDFGDMFDSLCDTCMLCCIHVPVRPFFFYFTGSAMTEEIGAHMDGFAGCMDTNCELCNNTPAVTFVVGHASYLTYVSRTAYNKVSIHVPG